MPISRFRAVIAATAVAAALVAAPALPATAAPAATGWVRVAHLSPDTTAMDVRLASLGGSSDVLAVDDVTYGSVSRYRTVPAGRYALAMRPAGSPASSTPVIRGFVSVTGGSASTIAVFGRNADLQTKVLSDSLTLPKGGDARVRVVQASTAASAVTLTAGSETIVSDAAPATVSRYRDVGAGTWRLTARQGAATSTSTVTLKAGQVASVFVLDDAAGHLVLRLVLDAASVGGVPKGYLATGGGYLATQAEQRTSTTLLAGLGGGAALLLAGAAALLVQRRRRAHA